MLKKTNTMTNILIGTSGWYYDHWEGPFYPAGLAKSKRLEFYCRHFHTVELNSTFYHLPKVKTAAHWLNDTPPSFRFAIKASRIITHIKKLKDSERSIKALFATIGPLKPKCAAVLFQLPPSLAPDCSLLEDFFSYLPEGWTHAIEFRNQHCYSDRILAILEKHGIAFCIHDYGKRPSPAVATSETVYYRFHGPFMTMGNAPPLLWQQVKRFITVFMDLTDITVEIIPWSFWLGRPVRYENSWKRDVAYLATSTMTSTALR